eukprot:9146901-Ditylum_brightwellii.AAC.1
MGGFDILASSKKFQLFVAKGNDDKPGFSINGKGIHTFDVQIPRDEWVHIAYVAANPPKKKISLYVNGRFCGRKDGEKCSLPMECIFADKDTFHGI